MNFLGYPFKKKLGLCSLFIAESVISIILRFPMHAYHRMYIRDINFRWSPITIEQVMLRTEKACSFDIRHGHRVIALFAGMPSCTVV